MDKALGNKIPEFNKKQGESGGSGLAGLSAFGSGDHRSKLETIVIVLVAVVIIGGTEILLRLFNVPQYILPKPTQIVTALFTEWHFLWPHVVVTLYELLTGFFIGGSIGFILAAVITQFPFVEKVVTPYILLLVTTPMLALVPLLILRFGFGSEPRIIAVALASGPMVMINAATGFRRVDLAKIALIRCQHTSDIYENQNPDGHADDHCRVDGRFDFWSFDGDWSRDGRGCRGAW